MSKRQRRRNEKQQRHGRLAPTKRHLAAVGGLTLGASLITGGTAQANTFEVNSLGDGTDPVNNYVCETATAGECTLRAAIEESNYDVFSDTITFASGLSGSINLTGNLPNISFDPMYINGPGAGTLTVDGGDNYSIIYSDRVYGYQGNPLFISGLTLANGYGGGGGAITNIDSDLTVGSSVITGSFAFVGGGIYNGYDGSNGYYGSLSVYSSTISGNAAYVGGGILNSTGGDVYDSTIAGNLAFAGGGLATYNSHVYTGFFSLGNSTVSGNYAYYPGGGIYDGRAPYDHYGLHDHIGGLDISNSTIAGNGAGTDGGGVYENPNNTSSTYFFYGSPFPYTYNTIVADNSAVGLGPDVFGTLESGFTLLENSSSATLNSNGGPNIVGQDPQLFPLGNNGGATFTHELAPTSPAVDKGSNYDGSYDQRGAPRPFDFSTIANADDGSDIGAFELQPGDIASAGAGGGGGGAGVTAPKCKGKTATIFARPGLARTFAGTNKRDVIVGTTKKDKINARGGNDLVCAKGGNDTVKGGGGKDKLLGQGGKDTLKGGGGKDTLKGGGGKDTLLGQGGNDLLSGGGKNDTCIGGAGKDTEKSC
ncbi:MAG: calcium-binding protein [Actinomycetota bacterium]